MSYKKEANPVYDQYHSLSGFRNRAEHQYRPHGTIAKKSNRAEHRIIII